MSAAVELALSGHRSVDAVDAADSSRRTATCDCLVVGFNDPDFGEYVDTVKSMGINSGAFQDLRLAYVDIDGQPQRALDVLSRYHGDGSTYFHNADFLWPAITYLGTFLHQAGLSFDYINLFHLQRDDLTAKLCGGDVRSVAITTTLYISPDPIIEIISFIRSQSPGTQVIVGGPYLSNQAKGLSDDDFEALLDYVGADIYVVGREGELTLSRVCAALRDDSPLEAIPNLVFRAGERFKRTDEELESNPLCDHLVDYSLFSPDDFNDFVTTRTAKSCPFSCAFCGFPKRAGKYTYLPVPEVERELDNIAALGGVSTLTFIDDTFNVPKKRFRNVLKMMINNDYGFRWNSFYRSDHGDEETIELMAQAGCEGVFLGIESGSDQMLERMNKAARRKDYQEALPKFREVGISTYASLIVGFPGETEETLSETISLLEEGQPDFYRAQLWYCDPVTPIWDRRDELQIKGGAFSWSHETMDSDEACAHIDRIFATVKGSIWLPQFGFEQWSVFYLQRRGMSMAEIKRFLSAFNGVVGEQSIAALRTGNEETRLGELRDACSFDLVLPAPGRHDALAR